MKHHNDLFIENILNTGLVTKNQITKAESSYPDLYIEEALEKMKYVTESQIYEKIAQDLDITLIDLTLQIPTLFTVRLVIPNILRKHEIIPVYHDGETIEIATYCPGNYQVIDDIHFATDRDVRESLAPRRQIIEVLNDILGEDNSQNENKMISEDEALMREKIKAKDIRLKTLNFLNFDDLDIDKEVVNILNQLLKNAVFKRASDMHFEPGPDELLVRDRIDGELVIVSNLNPVMGQSLCSRIKVLANVDITETSKPQDGSFTVTTKGQSIDLRVSTVPTSYGEKIVIRILYPDLGTVQLTDLGFSAEISEKIKEEIHLPQGLILVTGPTGSGKSSTLCSIINAVNTTNKNIISIEDPIEYTIKSVNQIQVDSKKGVTFATGLKAILRQDPDIVYVGEIRDSETAKIAAQAAQTGHMVFSTLHTIDSVSAVNRLTSMGVNISDITEALKAVLAQRLTRRVCPNCAKKVTPSHDELNELRSLPSGTELNLQRGSGCSSCYKSGYKGRIAVTELLCIDDGLRSLINQGASSKKLLDHARKNGFKTIWENGLILVAQGITTIEELSRHVPQTSANASDNRFPRSIQIVDDDAAMRDVIKETLSFSGIQVSTANDGDEAYKMVIANPPDMLITDLHMPNCDGLDLCRLLRNNPKTKSMPIIMLTGDMKEAAEVQSFEIGATDFINKPFGQKALLARIGAVYRRVHNQ